MAETKRIWASLDDFLPPSAGVNRVGRNMANHFFFRALMRYGTFDEYHFFLSNKAHRQLFLSAHEQFLTEVGVADRVVLFDRVDLPLACRSTGYTVFHQSDHVTHMAALCQLRDQVGGAFPVTAFIHSLSYPSYMSRYLEMVVAGPNEGDAILCSSECGRQVIETCLERAADAVGHQGPMVGLEVVPLGIDEGEAWGAPALARTVVGFDPDEVVALCFGRFSNFDKMDLFPLLSAFAQVGGRHRHWRLVLAGAVHDDAYLQMVRLWARALGVEPRVSFELDPDEERKRALFSACDFFVSLADNPQETFGLTVLEAMFAGKPLLVSDFDGYRELAGEETGVRVTTRWQPIDLLTQVEGVMDMRTLHALLSQQIQVDLVELKNGLARLFGDELFRKRAGLLARKRFDERFAHKRTIARLETLWDRLKVNYQPAKAGRKLAMNIGETFGHYPTLGVARDRKVVPSGFAKQLFGQGADYPLLPGLSEVVLPEVARQIVAQCPDAVTVGDVLDAVGDHWRAEFTFWWMLKQGLLELVPR